MSAPIRIAAAADTQDVARFFSGVYESRRGRGAATSQGLFERTIDVLFPREDAPTVLLYIADGDIHGVVAFRIDPDRQRAELVTVQAHDTVRGRSAAQQLLGETVRHCDREGVPVLVTDVPAADVRARGFLRREGFAVVIDGAADEAAPEEGVVTYARSV
ncbi:GNAT family N-acetyltransferase [Demequina sp. TTPB684]|uniref:GNAT family N-acetyltransferase n=1 Tax=unclassified Demequina TaxID=2620311 RepID=UPI001CF1AF41|nr:MULTISPECIES: GNAT family N-acetyltransferase [unclassified Demequina]MCB2412238.1 GNAT family N-acetyltransferase [Demequina sp. TTPB684]UPU87780.1 GNAT family N-acetyltransferase [Demequina sp. TMPB413]